MVEDHMQALRAATACNAQVIDMAEAANFQLSPQQDTWVRDLDT
jgi:hypothetical protein